MFMGISQGYKLLSAKIVFFEYYSLFKDSIVLWTAMMAHDCWEAEEWRYKVSKVLLTTFVEFNGCSEVYGIYGLGFPKNGRSLEILPSIFKNLESCWIAREDIMFAVRRLKREWIPAKFTYQISISLLNFEASYAKNKLKK